MILFVFFNTSIDSRCHTLENIPKGVELDTTGNHYGPNSEFLPTEILGRLENLYPQLSPLPTGPVDQVLPDFGAPSIELPTMTNLSDRVAKCSFLVFKDSDAFHRSPRAKEFVSWSSPRSDYYRIYFNTLSKKVYIDLNGKRWDEARTKLGEEILFCDILRTLIWVLTCEVERFEAQEAELNSDKAVSAGVIEVVIP